MRLVGDNVASGLPNWFKLPPQTANTALLYSSVRGRDPGTGYPRLLNHSLPLRKERGERAKQRQRGSRERERDRETVV